MRGFNYKKIIRVMLVIMFVGILIIPGCLSITIYSVQSETFALSHTDSKTFMYQPVKVERVYQYDKNGDIIQFEEGVDFIIDDRSIRRTEYSRIPDYSGHKVISDENGLFFFSDVPRNPELNIDYQILVDYTTILSPWRRVSPKPGVKKTVDKLKGGEKVKIILSGDSIATGAQTTGQYYFDDCMKTTFFGYLKEFLNFHYNTSVDAKLFSKGGTSLHFLKENLDNIIHENPDIVIIEFGMNDHVRENALSQKNKEDFSYSLNQCVNRLCESGSDVILVGFFQQNPKWEKEQTEATEVYNNMIEQIAIKYDIPFIDIEDAFSRIENKDMYEDVTSDYMHHPTDFGHKIYFSEIVPYFLNKSIRDIDNYIYLRDKTL